MAKKVASLEPMDFSLALALSRLDLFIVIKLYFIYMQDEFHVLCRFPVCDLLSFMPQERDCRKYNILYFISMYIIENSVHKIHKIAKNTYFRTSELKEN